MARHLQVNAVRLVGAGEPHVWKFPRGVTVIVGGSGGGKTSLLELIKFGLGGDASITKTLEDAAEGVVVDIQAGDRELSLERRFQKGKSVLSVVEKDTVLGEFSAKNSKTRPWVSDLLLEAIGIPAVRVPKSRSSSSHQLTPISFQDVFAYCYLVVLW